MDTQKLLDEIKSCSLDELKLIYETQKDLYTDEEMAVIQKQIKEIEAAEIAAEDVWIAEIFPRNFLALNVMVLTLLKMISAVFAVIRWISVNTMILISILIMRTKKMKKAQSQKAGRVIPSSLLLVS